MTPISHSTEAVIPAKAGIRLSFQQVPPPRKRDPRLRGYHIHIFSFIPQMRHSKKRRVLRSKTLALYLETRFGATKPPPKAGFHLAPQLRYGLDGMTIYWDIFVQKMCEPYSRAGGGPAFLAAELVGKKAGYPP